MMPTTILGLKCSKVYSILPTSSNVYIVAVISAAMSAANNAATCVTNCAVIKAATSAGIIAASGTARVAATFSFLKKKNPSLLSLFSLSSLLCRGKLARPLCSYVVVCNQTFDNKKTWKITNYLVCTC